MLSRLNSTRRGFLTSTAQGAVLAGSALAVGQVTAAESQPKAGDVPAKVFTFDTGTRRPHGIAASREGRVFVAADRRIVVFDHEGRQVIEIALERPVRAVAVHPDGDLLVALMHHVERFSPDGKRKAAWRSLGKESLISGLASTRDAVYAADAAAGEVVQFDTHGKVDRRIRRESSGFSAPAEFFSIAAFADGLHVAHPRRHRVERFSSDGKLLDWFGGRTRDLSGFSGCCNPVSLAVLGDGRIATAERGVPRVKLFSPDGKVLGQLLGPDAFVANARASAEDDGYGCSAGGLDLAVDSENRLFVLDRVTGRVHVLA
jgi:sugar lactone lactonase YvrE